MSAAHQLSEHTSYGPETLKVLGEAFDGAWAEIEPRYSAVTREAARMKLAELVIALADDGTQDPEQIKMAALRALERR